MHNFDASFFFVVDLLLGVGALKLREHRYRHSLLPGNSTTQLNSSTQQEVTDAGVKHLSVRSVII